jgi:hypothetical protein
MMEGVFHPLTVFSKRNAAAMPAANVVKSRRLTLKGR